MQVPLPAFGLWLALLAATAGRGRAMKKEGPLVVVEGQFLSRISREVGVEENNLLLIPTLKH